MVEFCKTIKAAEVKSYYLLDGRSKITYAEKHHRTQIWGMLRNWFIDNDIRAGSIVVVRYDPEEIRGGYSVVHLITPAIKYENIKMVC